MIPKTAHFYWGNPQMSWMRYMTLFSFRKLNPDWQIQLHLVSHVKDVKRWSTKETQDSFNFSGVDYLEQAKSIPGLLIKENEYRELSGMSPAQASDMFSWAILAGEGGFYSDMDILFVRSMSDFYEQVKGFDAVVGTVRENIFGIGFMASSGNSPLFYQALASAKKFYQPRQYESAGNNVLNRMSEGRASSLHQKFSNLRIHFLEQAIVYRWTHKQIEQIFEHLNEVPPPTVGIHWFAGHPMAQRYNNLLTGDNYNQHRNTFCKYAACVLGEI